MAFNRGLLARLRKPDGYEDRTLWVEMSGRELDHVIGPSRLSCSPLRVSSSRRVVRRDYRAPHQVGNRAVLDVRMSACFVA
jgi:hypothetical protein